GTDTAAEAAALPDVLDAADPGQPAGGGQPGGHLLPVLAAGAERGERPGLGPAPARPAAQPGRTDGVHPGLLADPAPECRPAVCPGRRPVRHVAVRAGQARLRRLPAGRAHLLSALRRACGGVVLHYMSLTVLGGCYFRSN